MSLIIKQKTEVYDPEVNNCICGGVPIHGANYGSGYSGSAYIQCPRCELKIDEYSDSVGWHDITLLSLYQRVVTKWNRVMPGK